jgi:hypothetical protein
MLGANVYIDNALNDNGTPTIAAMTVTGRSATMFVMVAGISLAFLSGGRHPVHGRNRRAASAAIALRALLIAAIGLALGWPDANLVVILPYYGLFFLLAIPLLGLRPRILACIAGALIVVGPLLRLAAFSAGLRDTFDSNPTLTAPFFHLSSFLLELLVTGAFPAVVYMAYICAGLAIGRLDLTSTKVAVRLLAGGLALAVTAWVASTIILFHLGGLQHLQAAAGSSRIRPRSPTTSSGSRTRWRRGGGSRFVPLTRPPHSTQCTRSGRRWLSSAPCCCSVGCALCDACCGRWLWPAR